MTHAPRVATEGDSHGWANTGGQAVVASVPAPRGDYVPQVLPVEKSACDWAALLTLADVHPLWEEDGHVGRAALLAKMAPLVHFIALTRQCDLDPALLATMPKLEFVAYLGDVEDSDALRALRERGVRVTGNKHAATCEHADFAVRAMLELLDLTASERSRIAWEDGPMSKDLLYAMRVEIVGSGACARAALQRFSAFDAAVRYTNPATPSDLSLRSHRGRTCSCSSVDEGNEGPNSWLGPETTGCLAKPGCLSTRPSSRPPIRPSWLEDMFPRGAVVQPVPATADSPEPQGLGREQYPLLRLRARSGTALHARSPDTRPAEGIRALRNVGAFYEDLPLLF